MPGSGLSHVRDRVGQGESYAWPSKPWPFAPTGAALMRAASRLEVDMMTTAEDVTRVERLEAEVRTLMALRASLVGKPATHGKRAELLAEMNEKLDELNQLTLGR